MARSPGARRGLIVFGNAPTLHTEALRGDGRVGGGSSMASRVPKDEGVTQERLEGFQNEIGRA